MAQHQVFEGVVKGVLHLLYIGIVGEHQHAGGHQCGEVPADIDELGQHRDIFFLGEAHRLQVAELQLGHAAALLARHHRHRDAVVFEDRDEILAGARLVAVHVAGGEQRDLASRPGRRFGGRFVRQHLVAQLRVAGAEMDGLGAQHQVREIEVPLMRRHVGALRHVAEVAEVAVLDDLPVVFLLDAVDFHRFRVIDKVEQRGEGLAEADAAAAAVADVEDALHLVVERRFVVKGGVLPVERMAGGRLEIAFACHAILLSRDVSVGSGVRRPAAA